jgi:ribosome-associated protein
MIEIKIKGDYIELFKLMKVSNMVGTGGEAKIHISEGLVMVNAQVETRKRYKVRPGDKVQFQEEILQIVS